jgi:hypothetical protein
MQLSEHLKTKEEDRNQAWDEKFFKMLSDSELKIMSEDPQQGPDGWPYLIAETLPAGRDDGDKIDSTQKILHWLSTRGIGLVVNPRRLPYPDYVFSYGMIWSFRETGYFMKYNTHNPASDFKIDDKISAKTGPPTAEYLPTYVRQILKNFLVDQGVFNPRILMIAVDGVNYDLCFSLESFGNPPESEHKGILEALSWFLPPHYSIALVSDQGLPAFENL